MTTFEKFQEMQGDDDDEQIQFVPHPQTESREFLTQTQEIGGVSQDFDQLFKTELDDEVQEPLFARKPMKMNPSAIQIKCACSAVNVVAFAFVDNRVIRIETNSKNTEEFEIAKGRSDSIINKIFMDPTGCHLIVSCSTGENFHIFKQDQRTKAQIKHLQKFKNLKIEVIAWNYLAGKSISTKEILLGCYDGTIYETCLEKKELYLKEVYKLKPDLNQKESDPITGLYFEKVPKLNAIYILVSTWRQLQQFVGLTSFENVFNKYASIEPDTHVMPSIGPRIHSELRVFREDGIAKSFSWLTEPGVYLAELEPSKENFSENKVVKKAILAHYPKLDSDLSSETPISILQTQFHFFLAYPDKIIAMSSITQKIIQDDQNYFSNPNQKFIGFLEDEKMKWIYSGESLSVIYINKEEQNLWRIYLEKKEFDNALCYATEKYQRQIILKEQADSFYEQKQYQKAALTYAKTYYPFEDVALRFLSINDIEALKIYLLQKIDSISKDNYTQVTLLSSWIIEIYLEQLNQANELRKFQENRIPQISNAKNMEININININNENTNENTNENIRKEQNQSTAEKDYIRLQREFHNFLTEKRDILHHHTTFNLICSRGLIKELLFYASLIKQYEEVILHYIQQGEYLKVLEVMNERDFSYKHTKEELFNQNEKFKRRNEDILFEESKKQEMIDLIYRYSPILMSHVPEETVNLWMSLNDLDPKRLLPALMRYEHPKENPEKTNQAIRYLEFCVARQRNQDPVIHNYLLSLYVNEAKKEQIKNQEKMIELKEEQNENINNENNENNNENNNNQKPDKMDKSRFESQTNFIQSYQSKEKTAHRKLLFFLNPRSHTYFYDLKYALRLCSKAQITEACVFIYSEMGLYDEAVDLALEVDVELAKMQIEKVIEDNVLRKKLWLKIAKFVIEDYQDIKQAINFIKESSDLIGIEDILPFIPEFSSIDDFKNDICNSIEGYNKKIEDLQVQMDTLTSTAEVIRSNMKELRNGFTIISSDKKCDICFNPIRFTDFVSFSCSHVFHFECFKKLMLDFYLSDSQKRKVEMYEKKIAQELEEKEKLREIKKAIELEKSSRSKKKKVPLDSQENQMTESEISRKMESIQINIEKYKMVLEDILLQDCVICGEIVIKSISKPFVDPNDEERITSWKV
ncbi:vacuolar protein sorting-associated protein [Anaeramoeba ignava]|uniref:Vacuolar protein sorting-associated protein n=1 Tax=Anaeramoeba ignava TaxID=1746090 RepID=A0A9Q0LK81_ANAIG|nr:vacuolar protein sorting-associated protein [Anaeramoeba ignava]|eukprot:Anaeramoba_ignava/c18082_g1_i1.p1 GENE.c18082_g1_i1~~c18082_g1_i1.p1  ORF type:complete len:1154 (+),score=377.37 c18082_g1_i1:36-3497(+)